MTFKSVIFSIIFLASSLAFSAQEAKTLKLPTEGVNKLEINCGAGFLKVRGAEELNSIEVKAEIYVKGVGDKDMKKFPAMS